MKGKRTRSRSRASSLGQASPRASHCSPRLLLERSACSNVAPRSCSVAQSYPTLCEPMDCSTPGFPVFCHLWSLLKLMSIKLVIPSNHLSSATLFLLPSVFSSIRVFSNESALCIRWPKDWTFSFSVSPSNEYSGLISSRFDEFDLLALQGTLKSLIQHHDSKTPILCCSENPMDGGAWKAMVHGVAEGQTRLSDFTFTFHFYELEKEMATHSNVLAWRIPGMREPGGLLSMGSHRVRHD